MPKPVRPSIRDVAREAGVAVATVSRVLSGNATVGDELRERVLDAARRLNYEPNFMAQGLRRGRSNAVGFVADDLSNPLTSMIATGAESVLREAGLMLMVMNSNHDPRTEAAHLRYLHGRRIDGILVTSSWDFDTEVAMALRDAEVPVVLIESEMPADVGACIVVADHRAGVRDAMERLIAVGHRNLGLLPGPLRFRAGRERLAGANEAAALARNVSLHYVECELDASAGHEATLHLLATRPRLTSLIVGGNQMLEGVLGALLHAGRRPGVDVALVTSDEVPANRVHSPALSSISRDALGIGSAAAKILVRQMAVAVAPETVILPTATIWRESCPPPTSDGPDGVPPKS